MHTVKASNLSYRPVPKCMICRGIAGPPQTPLHEEEKANIYNVFSNFRAKLMPLLSCARYSVQLIL